MEGGQFLLNLGAPQQGAELVEQHHPGPGPHRVERSQVELDNDDSVSERKGEKKCLLCKTVIVPIHFAPMCILLCISHNITDWDL